MSTPLNTPAASGFTVRALGPTMGVEITGLDAAVAQADTTIAWLRALLQEHSVVCLRGQTLTEEQQIAFWTQVYDPAQGAVISSGFYGLSEGGTGQLTPAPGSVLSPLALVVEGGQASWSQLSDETFDANAMISSDLADIPAGAQIYLELNAKDAAGNIDYMYHVKNY